MAVRLPWFFVGALLFVIALGATPRHQRLADMALGAGLMLSARALFETEED